MKQYLYQYLEKKKLAHLSAVTSLRGWKIPYAPQKNSLYANSKGLLVGDAAGLTDPITGEGIFYALKEAKIASQIITEALTRGKGGLHAYNTEMEAIRKDLSYALKLQRILYTFPKISRKLMMVYGHKLGGKYLDIITGKFTYAALYRKIFSPKGILALFSFSRQTAGIWINPYR